MTKKRAIHWVVNVILKPLFLGVVVINTIIALVMVGTYLYFARDLGSKDNIMNRNDQGVTLLDRHNKPFFTFYEAKQKEFVPLSKVPLSLQHAVVAAEDNEFYEHPGFSVKGILRAAYLNWRKSDSAYGGSTITQQLVKNALLNKQKRLLRKIQELVLAIELERRYSKNEILEMYLNSIYLGEGAVGVEEAAQVYFGKHAQDLDLAQSSFIAAILPAPSELSPFSGGTDAAKQRQLNVLTNMVDEGYISENEKIAAVTKSLQFHRTPDSINQIAPHFALYVKQLLLNKYGENQLIRSGYQVRTSLDLTMQRYAEKTVTTEVERLKDNDVTNGAAVVMDPKTGEILVMVGSKDWYDSKFGKVNIATTPRQPGSSFKPIVYSLAFQTHTITPSTLLRDLPTTFAKTYKPLDYDRKFRGMVLPRRALANSLNIPAVQVISRIGIEPTLEFAKELGITSLGGPSDYGPSLVLGTGEVSPLELTNVYATLANDGSKHEPTAILEIQDKFNKTIYTSSISEEKVIDPGVAFLISSILSDNRARAEAFGNALTISRPAAVKTGTTDDYKDAWTLGYTPQLAVGVWVGNNDNKPMDRIAGSLGAAPIWKALMEHYLADEPIQAFVKPRNVTRLAICSQNGFKIKSATNSAQIEYFLPGTEPKKYCG